MSNKELDTVEVKDPGKAFGALLKTYRERTKDPEKGGRLTQAKLAELTDCGFSGTTVGHWETGERTIRHHDRVVLQALIRVLHQYGGLQTLDEANQLLETGLYSRLTDEEIRSINPDWLAEEGSPPESAPASPVTIILSPRAIYEAFDAIFRWSEADTHARSSWAGMVIWSLSAITKRINAHGLFHFLSYFILWILASWLIVPLLQWPIRDPAMRRHAALSFAFSTVAVPLTVALLTPGNNPVPAQTPAIRQRKTHLLLKITGAAVGFNTVTGALWLIALGLFYLGASVPSWPWRFALLLPLLMAHIGARRIPADRAKMYAGNLRMHAADSLFLVTFLLIGAGIGAFAYVGHNVISSKATGLGVLIALAGLALWHRMKR